MTMVEFCVTPPVSDCFNRLIKAVCSDSLWSEAIEVDLVSSVCSYGLGTMPSQIIQASTGPTVQPAADHTMRRGPPPDTSTNLSTRLSTTMEQPWEGGIILNPAQQTLSLLIINTSKNIYIYIYQQRD